MLFCPLGKIFITSRHFQEEEYAGSSMMCFDDKSKHWSLIGVSGWRIACTKIGLGRPRIYDAVTSHVDWIQKTILNSSR